MINCPQCNSTDISAHNYSSIELFEEPWNEEWYECNECGELFDKPYVEIVPSAEEYHDRILEEEKEED